MSKKVIYKLILSIGAICFLLCLFVVNKFLTDKEAYAISIIGGADGPTSIFLAGKVGDGLNVAIGVGVIVILALGIVFFVKKKK